MAGEEDEEGGEVFDDHARRSDAMHHVHIRSYVAQQGESHLHSLLAGMFRLLMI